MKGLLLTPVVGELTGVAYAISGRDIFGNGLSPTERGLALTPIAGRVIGKAVGALRATKGGAQVAKELEDAYNAARAAKTPEELAEASARLTKASQAAKSLLIDPQLDNNILSALINPKDPNHAAAVAYANANKAAGLSVNRSAYREFLKSYSKEQFAMLKDQYGIKLIRDIPLAELEKTASRLQAAFTDARVLSDADARVASSAYLQGEKLATNDLQFFKSNRSVDFALWRSCLPFRFLESLYGPTYLPGMSAA